MSNVTIYTKDYCGFSARAKALLTAKGIGFTEIDVTVDQTLEAEMIERSGRRTVPQIFIEDRHVGGFDDLAALDAKGNLDLLLDREAKELAAEYRERLTVAKLNVDENPEKPAAFGIRSDPTRILFHDGQPAQTMVGVQPMSALKAAVDAQLG